MEWRLKPKHYFLLIPVLITLTIVVIVKPGKRFKFHNTTVQFADHNDFSELLRKHVDINGSVDYSGFQNDSELLNKYLRHLQQHPPDSKRWPKNEQLAYWINVYNAFTIKLIIDHYPIKSIKDIGSSVQIPLVNSPWDISFIEIGDQLLTLNDVEHRILRKEFNEPRIHFAIVCASISCPNLKNEAYVSTLLEDQLNDQAIAFINDPSKNELTADQVKLSKIFSWFGGDFDKESTLIEYLNQFSKMKINEDADRSFIDYNWGINDQNGHSSTNGS